MVMAGRSGATGPVSAALHRRRRTRGVVAFLLLCGLVAMIVPGGRIGRAGTLSCPTTRLEAMFARGEWRAAADLGESSECAAALAIAARSLLAEGSFLPAGHLRDRLLDRAVRVAERALATDPDLLEAHLQAAAAYGFRAARERSIGDVRRSKRELKAARRLAPDDPLVLAAWGYWHGRTVLGAGAFAAALLFGARKSAARRAFSRALERAPGRIAIVTGYGRLLIRFADRDWRRGIALLERARALPPRDALEARLKEQALLLLAAHQGGADGRALKRLADLLAPFADRRP